MEKTTKNLLPATKRKRRRKMILVVLAALALLYFTLVNFLVSAALVPSFMEKLDAFERITTESYAMQVQADDIKANRKEMLDSTEEWLASARGQKLTRKSTDGYNLTAQEFFTDGASHQWVLLLHGYTGWKEEMYPFAHWYSGQGFHVLVPDLRCQGESEGDFIGMGWTDHEDGKLWLDYILSQDSDASIVIHGQSMGAATALIMTGSKLPANVKAVISDCAYTDAYAMFSQKITEWFHLPAFPLVDTARLMLKLRGGYDLKNASAIDAVHVSSIPTLFIHGGQDAMIPVQMSKDLYKAAACPKKIIIIEGAGHAQSHEKAPNQYYGAIRSFLDAYS